ncbi:hypothetical protein, partial [Klebsiella oxytoca]|uniref:hypothetical protein n=1 Tax=Klebsiella oxytoca TaxID=571 RepID=UPI001B2FF3ED
YREETNTWVYYTRINLEINQVIYMSRKDSLKFYEALLVILFFFLSKIDKKKRKRVMSGFN